MPDSFLDQMRQAAAPLAGFLPARAWLPYAMVRKANGRWDKPPRGGATSSNPASWYTLEKAIEFCSGTNDAAGVGFAIVKGIIGLDYDNCRNPTTGELTEFVQSEIERLNSFTYVTPSKTGVRIMSSNDAGLRGCKRVCWFPNGQKLEIFIGPTNHYNTFTAEVIPGYDVVRDVSNEVADYLNGLPGSSKDDRADVEPPATAEPQRQIHAIRHALQHIPNDRQDWDAWVRIGLAVYRSSGGSPEGLEAWREWSARHPCHDDGETVDHRWQRFHTSPPTRIGFGTLYREARQHNPLYVAPLDTDEEAPEHQAQQLKTERARGLRLLSIAELKALPLPVWLVDGLVPEKSLVVPYGPPKKGKTFIVLSMSLHIAAGMDWMGRKVVQGGVVYIAGEGVGGLGVRITAMQQHYGIGDNVPFWVVPGAINFSDAKAVAGLIQLVRDTVLDEPISLVVVDTLARAMPGVDENSSQEVGLVIAACDRIKVDLDCSVMPIHHAGKDIEKGLRGSSAIHGAVDASFSINGTTKSVTLTPVDQKEADPGPSIVFEMVEVMVGIGRSTIVPVLANFDMQKHADEPKKHHLSSNESLALRALQNALAEHGSIEWTSGIPANVQCVRDDQWREAFRNLKAGEDWPSARRLFSRVSTQLIQRKIVGSKVPFVWAVSHEEDMQ